MIDCYSRRLVGWAIADHMRTSLVEDALKAAAATRGSLAGAVFHSDHGSVYTSKDYAHLCADLGVTQSMGAVGTSADNALAESFNATLKREILQDENYWPDEITCRRQAFRWLTRYNTRRRPPGAATNPRSTTRPATPLHSRQRRNHTPVSKNRGEGPSDRAFQPLRVVRPHPATQDTQAPRKFGSPCLGSELQVLNEPIEDVKPDHGPVST